MLEADEILAKELAVGSLAYSQQPGVGEWLCQWLRDNQSPCSRWRRRSWQSTNASPKLTYQSVLRTLKYFPAEECERLLVNAASDRDRDMRMAALGSLGWWVPLDRTAMLDCLYKARLDCSITIQGTAQAALARLGERQALQWFRRQFAAENSDRVHQVLDLISREGILLLWPDLDHLTDAQDSDVAHHACETLELLREDFILSGSMR
jgi:hypothetical protein